MCEVCSMRGGKAVPAGAVRIDRATKWGNPFAMKNSSMEERRRVIDEYKRWLWKEITAGKVKVEDLAELAGKDLYCWCAPLPCHGDVLAKAAEWAAKR